MPTTIPLPTPLNDLTPGDLSAISFDLDDTLHDFRGASKAGMDAVYDYISEIYGVPQPRLEKAYGEILAEAQSHHFVTDKPAKKYREARFEKLLDAFSIIGVRDLDHCLTLYQFSLDQATRPLDGAGEALKAAKDQDLMVLVISEGPHDAQTHALEQLGFSGLVDHLITSSKTGKSKSDGLYQATAKRLRLEPANILHVGDNPDRDTKAAEQAGWKALTVHAAEEKAGPRINSLTELAAWLSQA
ncbi:MAG: HAD family hydrolase [Alphaproteobacteria bacterium]|nr:HAD family hydrolase [Alphaproteobacteria bacterium SS10]